MYDSDVERRKSERRAPKGTNYSRLVRRTGGERRKLDSEEGQERRAEAAKRSLCGCGAPVFKGDEGVCNTCVREQRAELLEALSRITRMEDGDLAPGDVVEMMDGYNTHWTGEIIRENDVTFTVKRRADGLVKRWNKESVYPHDSMWDTARAAIAKAEGSAD